MNVGAAERVDILGWLDRSDLDAVAFSWKFFSDVILANQGVLPLREVKAVSVRRIRWNNCWSIDVTPTSLLPTR